MFSSKIWKILPDISCEVLVVECRDEANLHIDFFIFQLGNLEIQQILMPAAINWWSILQAINSDRLYFSVYENTKNPGPAQLIVYDFIKGEVVDSLDHFQLKHISEKGIVGIYNQKEERLIPFLLSKNTNQWIQPHRISKEEESFELFNSFIQKSGTYQVETIAYAEISLKQLAVISFISQSATGFSRYVLVLKDGKQLMLNKIDENMKGLADDGFILTPNHLIFAENLKTLIVYDIK